jgi:DNA-binding NtrC family response regulator
MPDHNDKKSRILFVDDEQLLHGVLERLLGRHGIAVTSCSGAVQAVKELKNQSFDMVITDFKMPKMDGLELLAHVRQHHPCTKVIMITAHANVQHAVKERRGGRLHPQAVCHRRAGRARAEASGRWSGHPAAGLRRSGAGSRGNF